MAGDEHISNLNTLNGLFNQMGLSDIRLIICNDNKEYFKCASIIEHIMISKKTDDFAQIIIHENEKNIGINTSVRLLTAKYESDYVVLVRCGELLHNTLIFKTVMDKLASSGGTKFTVSRYCTLYKSDFIEKVPEYVKPKRSILDVLRKINAFLRGWK